MATPAEAQVFIDKGFTPQVGESIDAFVARMGGGATTTTVATRQQLIQMGMIPGNGGAKVPTAQQIISSVAGPGVQTPGTPSLKAGDDPSLLARATALIPGGAAGLAGLTLGGIGAAGLAGVYGLSQAVGLQYPWETATGEGFIMPWTESVRDEEGRWVTRQSRPDLFAGGAQPGSAGLAGLAGIGAAGGMVVKTWTTTVARKDGTLVQTPFVMFASGKIAVMKADGSIKVYKPKKHIILPRGTTTLSQAVKAQKYLDRLWKTAAKRTKALKLA